MTTDATPPERPADPSRRRGPLGWLLAVIMAPGLWLERSRGVGRLALVLLYSLIVAVSAVLLWRAATLNGLPDVGDPPGASALEHTKIPPKRNAFVLYRLAMAELAAHPFTETSDPFGEIATGMASRHPDIRAWVDRNEKALALWEQGTTRPEAFDAALLRPNRGEPQPVVRALRAFAVLGALKATQLEEAGDLAGAWQWHRAVLRSSRHLAMCAPWEGRLVSIEVHEGACAAARLWSKNLKNTTALLRVAIADLKAIDEMTPPNARTLEAEFVKYSRMVDELPRWVGHTKLAVEEEPPEVPHQAEIIRFLNNEPKRSRRVLRLIFANWFAECDRPSSARPKPEFQDPELFADPEAPPSAQAISPASLRAWLLASDLSHIDLPAFEHCESALNERTTRAGLIVSMAEQCYYRDTRRPATSPSDLIGLYLDRIPDGFEPGPDNFVPLDTEAAP